MQPRISLLAGITCLLLTSSTQAQKEKWLFQSAFSAAHFKVKHLLIGTVRGSFYRVEGEVTLDEDMSKSSVTAIVHTSSLVTGNSKRDRLLRGKTFFDTSTYPTITFTSKKVDQTPEGNLLVTGDLTMHGVTKEVTLEVEGPTSAVKDPAGIPTRALTARTKLDRKDFGLTWNEALQGGGMMIGDEVVVEIDIELIRTSSEKT